MVHSLDVTARPTFSQIAQQFDGVRGNTHLRLKEDHGVQTLYTHSGLSSSGDGLFTKQSQIMERRNRATDMVVEAFKREYSGNSDLVIRVLKHVAKDDSFQKDKDGHLQLRTEDVGRLRDMMRDEMVKELRRDYSDHSTLLETVLYNAKRDPSFPRDDVGGLAFRQEDIARLRDMMDREIAAEPHVQSGQREIRQFYSLGVASAAIGQNLQIPMEENAKPALQGGKTPQQIRDGYQFAAQDEISKRAGVAVKDPRVQGAFSGGVREFMYAVKGHTDVMLSQEFMNSPGLGGGLKPLIGASLMIALGEDLRSPQALSNMPVALRLSTGSEPSSPVPVRRDLPVVPEEGGGARQRSERAILSRHEGNLINLNNSDRQLWVANETLGHFFGEPPLVTVGGEVLTEARTRLEALDNRITELRSRLPGTPQEMEKILRTPDDPDKPEIAARKAQLTETCRDLARAGAEKLSIVKSLVESGIQTELTAHPRVGGDNPILEALTPLVLPETRERARQVA